jgi:hypothetical protein
MSPLHIIKTKIDTMGFPIDQGALAKIACGRVKSGYDLPFTYGRVLFTVSKEGCVHLYAIDSPHKLLHASAQFMKDVWKRTAFTRLFCPIHNEKVKHLAKRFGWNHFHTDQFGTEWFEIYRSV